MCATFTDDDVGKTVENPNGTEIGVVASLEGETALVEPEPNAMDSIKAALGWEHDPDETMRIEPSSVDVITGETVRLERDRSAEIAAESAVGGSEDGEDDGHDAVVEQDEDTGGSRSVGATGNTADDVKVDEKAQVEGEAGSDRHEDNEDAPPHGDRTVTRERGHEDDR